LGNEDEIITEAFEKDEPTWAILPCTSIFL